MMLRPTMIPAPSSSTAMSTGGTCLNRATLSALVDPLIAAFLGCRAPSDGTITIIDGAMMGLAGTVVGASAAGIVGIVRSIAETWLPGVGANTDRKRQMHVNLQSQCYEAVKQWRAGLAGARDTYRQCAAGPRDNDAPTGVGDEWFEGLRPYLPTRGEAKYRTAHEVHCDNPSLMLLSLEIGRTEKERIDEANGRPRRLRKRRDD
jgi:hypothetical protein